MRLRDVLFGSSTIEYLSYRHKEREIADAAKKARRKNSETEKKDFKMSRWVAAEEDWPGHHSADVPDHEAAKLIWKAEFTAAGERLTTSYRKQPVAVADPSDEPV